MKKRVSFYSFDMSPPRKTVGKEGKTKSPVSNFKKKGYKGQNIFKDATQDCHLLFVEGLQQNIVRFWVEKSATKPEENAFLVHNNRRLLENEEVMAEIGIKHITSIKGVDGKTHKPASPGRVMNKFMQYLGTISEDDDPKMRKEMAQKLITELNTACNFEYQYPKKHIKFGGDKSHSPLRPVSSSLLDKDVILFIQDGFQGQDSKYTLKYIANAEEFTEIMSQFWENPEEGKKAMEDADEF